LVQPAGAPRVARGSGLRERADAGAGAGDAARRRGRPPRLSANVSASQPVVRGQMKALVPAVVVAALCALAVPFAVADPALTGYPRSIAATGDSITRAFDTCSSAFTDCPARSWSAGTNATVNSNYRRILTANPSISGRTYNDAKTGGKMVDL